MEIALLPTSVTYSGESLSLLDVLVPIVVNDVLSFEFLMSVAPLIQLFVILAVGQLPCCHTVLNQVDVVCHIDVL